MELAQAVHASHQLLYNTIKRNHLTKLKSIDCRMMLGSAPVAGVIGIYSTNISKLDGTFKLIKIQGYKGTL